MTQIKYEYDMQQIIIVLTTMSNHGNEQMADICLDPGASVFLKVRIWLECFSAGIHFNHVSCDLSVDYCEKKWQQNYRKLGSMFTM